MNSQAWKEFLESFEIDLDALFQQIRAAKIDSTRNRELRTQIFRRFFSQLLTDDERASLEGLPKGCRIREGAKIFSPEKLSCKENVWIGENALLDASGGLSIGSNTTIGCGVFVWTHHSMLTNLLESNVPSSPLIVRKRTEIGNGCYLVGPSVINPGIKIGDHCVVLPMTVVTKDVAPSSIVAGSPHKVIGTADSTYIDHLKNSLHPQAAE